MHSRKNDQKGKEDQVQDQPDNQQDDHCPGAMRVRGPTRVEHTWLNSATEGKANNLQIPRSNHLHRSFQPSLFRVLTETTDVGGDPKEKESF